MNSYRCRSQGFVIFLFFQYKSTISYTLQKWNLIRNCYVSVFVSKTTLYSFYILVKIFLIKVLTSSSRPFPKMFIDVLIVLAIIKIIKYCLISKYNICIYMYWNDQISPNLVQVFVSCKRKVFYLWSTVALWLFNSFLVHIQISKLL